MFTGKVSPWASDGDVTVYRKGSRLTSYLFSPLFLLLMFRSVGAVMTILYLFDLLSHLSQRLRTKNLSANRLRPTALALSLRVLSRALLCPRITRTRRTCPSRLRIITRTFLRGLILI
jgi:hypothetical protein